MFAYNEVLYLHWDPRCRFNHAKEYGLVYAGICLPGNISDEQIQRVKDLNFVEINKKQASFVCLGRYLQIIKMVKELSWKFGLRPWKNHGKIMEFGVWYNVGTL